MDVETTPPEISITREIPVDQIDPPTLNPREEFPDDEIADLADSIEAVGLLAPVIVRPSISDTDRFELIAGECRLRAVQRLGWPTITAIVRDLDDQEAAEIRLIENIKRNDLNAAEVSRGLKTLQELGHTPETLAELLRVSAEDIEARLRLAELPEFWQRWLRADDADHRRGPAAERLVPWVDCPQVLEAMERVIGNKRWPMTLGAWQREIREAVLSFSRSMDADCPTGPLFKITADVRERLQVRELRVGGEVQDRALNCDLWDTLQDEAVRQPAKSTAINPGNNGKARNTTPEATSANLRNGSPVMQPPEPPALQDDDGPDEGDYLQRLARWKDGWLRELIARRLTEIIDLAELERTAGLIGIDGVESWETSRSFLDLHSGPQLAELAELWGVDVSECASRSEAIAVILHSRRSHSIPPAVLTVSEMVDTADV